MKWEDGFYFDLSDEEKASQEAARNFATKEVLPLAAKIDKEHYFPKELIPKLGSLGFFGVCVPEEYGGSGFSQVAYCLVIEEISAACASTGVILSAHNSLCLSPIIDYATPDQKKMFLPKLASGEHLGSFSLSEPGTGSDAASMTCKVEVKGDSFIVNGTKNWTTNGPQSDINILIANSDTSLGHKGVTAFVHPMDLPGITRGKPEDKLGIRGSGTCSINYTNVTLTKEHLLSEVGKGFKVAMTTLNGGRTGVAAQAIGIARAALRDAIIYGNERKAFGKKVTEHQSIQNYLSEMITKIDASRLLTLNAAKKKDLKLDYARQAAQAKLFSSETAMEASIKGIQIHGGYGYVTEYPAERHLRDAKITEIYEGTSEIQKIVIASSLLKESV